MRPFSATPELRSLRNEVLGVRRCLIERECKLARQLATLSSSRRDSARNLIHYLALRRYNVRELQEQLARVGLSSLGRSGASAARQKQPMTPRRGWQARAGEREVRENAFGDAESNRRRVVILP